MPARAAVATLVAVTLALGACSGGTAEKAAVETLESTQVATATLTAQSTTRFMAMGDFNAAVQSFSAALRTEMPPAELQAAWTSATASLGQFVSIGAVATSPQGDATLFAVPVTFSGGSTSVRMQFNRSVQVVELAIG